MKDGTEPLKEFNLVLNENLIKRFGVKSFLFTHQAVQEEIAEACSKENKNESCIIYTTDIYSFSYDLLKKGFKIIVHPYIGEPFNVDRRVAPADKTDHVRKLYYYDEDLWLRLLRGKFNRKDRKCLK